MKELLILLSRIMHEMQKERSCVVLYLCSNWGDDDDGMRQKFLESNFAAKELSSKIQTWIEEGRLQKNLKKKFDTILNEITNISVPRDLVLSKEISVTDSLSVYSYKIIEPIIDLIIEVALSDPKNDSAHVSAFSNFLYYKERIARENDHCTRGLISDGFRSADFIEKCRALTREQESYKDTFMTLATEDQKQCYERYMKDNSVRKIDEMHDRLKKYNSVQNDNISPIDWFEQTTRNIDLMYKVVIDLIGTLENKEKSLKNRSRSVSNKDEARLYVGMNSFTKNQQEFIQTLPLFKGLSEKTLTDLLKNASIGNYKKGKLLFLEGDVSDKLYIILDGWVKLYKGNSSGEETIVQMLTSGDMVAESAVFLNAPFPISAQVAKEARILTLPAANIRNNININNDLAVNVLTAMSVHSQMLMQGLESIRLKSATERVGWFLLKLLLEQGRVPDMVELPYDKSLIASYLDMKPETFSRTLKKFKQKGFEIRKDAVILPQVKALCGFCDSNMSSICARHGTPECPNPDCISSKDEIAFYD